MAIGFLHIARVSRGLGATACARLAYISRRRVLDPRTGITHDFNRKNAADVLASGVIGWNGDAPSLAQAMSKSEKRRDACEGRSVIIAVPHELTITQAVDLVAAWCHALHRCHGVACIWVLHAPDLHGDTRNIHAHVLITTRRSNGENLGEKARELDDQRSGPKVVEAWRTEWGRLAVEALRAADRPASVDMRSWVRRLTAEGLPADLVEGEEHLGPARAAVERRGQRTEAGTRNRQRRWRRRVVAPLIAEWVAEMGDDKRGQGVGRRATMRKEKKGTGGKGRLDPTEMSAIAQKSERERKAAGLPKVAGFWHAQRLDPNALARLDDRARRAKKDAQAAKRSPKPKGQLRAFRPSVSGIPKVVRAAERVVGALLDEAARGARGGDEER